MEYSELFLNQKEAVRGRTRQVVGLIREEHFAWRPEAAALSVGEMLRHLWHSEENIRRIALHGDFSYFEKRIPQGLRSVLGAPTTLAEELAALERVHNETLQEARSFPAARWEEERIHEGIGYHRKAYAILLGINEHEIHHRAQLMTYLRILGTPVPEAINRR